MFSVRRNLSSLLTPLLSIVLFFSVFLNTVRAENVNWKLTPRTTFSETFEFYPRINFDEYRTRLEATLSYNLWRYVYLNLSVRDAYDTEPVAGTSADELLFHSALGVKF